MTISPSFHAFIYIYSKVPNFIAMELCGTKVDWPFVTFSLALYIYQFYSVSHLKGLIYLYILSTPRSQVTLAAALILSESLR